LVAAIVVKLSRTAAGWDLLSHTDQHHRRPAQPWTPGTIKPGLHASRNRRIMREGAMNRLAAVIALLFLVGSAPNALAEKAPKKVADAAKGTLAKLGTDKVVVEAVKKANAQGKTLQQIKELDEKWKADAKQGVAPYMQELMENPCAKQLKALMAKQAYITEIFVTDNQGANVCQTAKTGDYWQGDEDKFTKVFKKGILVSDVEVEDGKRIAQVSVPVKEGKEDVGTMTIGVDVDKVR
jgi:hypothetical protein